MEKLDPDTRTFVLHFGEMGSHWGINRTVGQVYALLYLAESPLCADDIVQALGVSRSNVSMSLKELQAWRLVKLQHIGGDRRDFFSTPDDVWEIARTLIEERRKRELDPTLSVLRDLMLNAEDREETHGQRRIREMHDLLEQSVRWSDDLLRLNPSTLKQVIRLGDGVRKLVDFGARRDGT